MISLSNFAAGSIQNCHKIINESGINITAATQTIQSEHTRCRLPGRTAERKTLINNRNTKRRVLWCKAYNNMDTTQWKNIIFSDECRMEITLSYHRYVRRPDGHRLDPKYIMKNIRFCSKFILIWGAIKGVVIKIIAS